MTRLTICKTDENHCGNPDPNGLTPCQTGFGLCEIVPPPKCGTGSGTTNGRAIGYYQASNTYDRVCNKISPSHIVTHGLTHLYFAFAQVGLTYIYTVSKSRGLLVYSLILQHIR